MKLWKLIQKIKKDKTQISGELNNGRCGYCIDGLIIKAIEPNMPLEYASITPIYDFVEKHPDKFDMDYDSIHTVDIDKMVRDLKKHYEKTGKISMRMLYRINDAGIAIDKPFTFMDFQKLFKEMDVEI